ncbi:MAG: 2Fe-2S iron-sulfur cluster binding domain-containing protein [Candidatus Aminicenantes bacterium]|nr:2Fe-2S iron-sulfur cluster binding domain-containing protein [Candidatus Aminicenantes bacterium]
MIKIFIDKDPVEVEEGTTVLKAAERAGIHIPHLCYHPAFPPEGSCRMCLVEIEGFPKLELACSTVVKKDMKISTKSERVVEARKAVLEFLLAEHPLDCPICDKAGDCKLQDYYDEYGLFESQFKEVKEKREKKLKIGKTLILDQERCILCTRCVRFLREVTETQELGVFHRGVHSSVNIYDGATVVNNYAGNLAEICPVGAITDEDFRFKTRSWFLEKRESICPLCSRGCNILIEYHPGFARFEVPKKVYRIKARENPEVNGFWICDRGRYGYSYLEEGRADQIILNKIDGENVLTWENISEYLGEKIKRLYSAKKATGIALILHTWLSNEELFLVHKIFKEDLKVEKIFFADPPQIEADGYLLTSDPSPNIRGALEIGFDIKTVDLDALADGTDFLLAFGPFLSGLFSLGDLKEALDKIKGKVLFSYYSNELNSLFDIVIPVALIAEKAGSLTNVDGIVQSFQPALEPPGESLPEWKVLADLGKKLGIDSKFFEKFTSPDAILGEMGKKITFFQEKE